MSASRLRAAALASARQQRPRRAQPWVVDQPCSSSASPSVSTAARCLHSTTKSTAPVTPAAQASQAPLSPSDGSMSSSLGRSLQGPAFFSSTPRSSWPHSSGEHNEAQREWVSDDEFQLRIGRAIDLLRATMPDFLRTGLSDYDSVHSDPSGMPPRNRSGLHLPSFDLAALLHGGSPSTGHHTTYHSSSHSDSHLVPVYSPSIKFCVKAMGSADSDPDSTPGLSFSGRTLYHGSAHVLRHALAALFYDSRVALESVQIVRGPADCSASSSSQVGSSEAKPASNMPFGPSSSSTSASSSSRNLSLLLRLKFEGSLRVTRAQHTYHLLFRYDFDPATGQIRRHIVERIEPALGRKLWAGLSTAFLRLAGLHPQGAAGVGQPHPATAAAAARAYLSASTRGRQADREEQGEGVTSETGSSSLDHQAQQRPTGGFLSPQPCMATLPPRRRMPMLSGRPVLRGQHRELSTSAVRRDANHVDDEDKARKALSTDGQPASKEHQHQHQHTHSASASLETQEAILDEEAYKAALLKARLSLTFTCTVTDCGHRSTHEFSRHSYERGIVIVQCPGCKNRHLIADHLSWFTETADEPRTIEQMVAAKGGEVRRGVAYSDEGTGETVEIVPPEGHEGQGEKS